MRRATSTNCMLQSLGALQCHAPLRAPPTPGEVCHEAATGHHYGMPFECRSSRALLKAPLGQSQRDQVCRWQQQQGPPPTHMGHNLVSCKTLQPALQRRHMRVRLCLLMSALLARHSHVRNTTPWVAH